MTKVPSKIMSEMNQISDYVGKTTREIGKIRNLSR
jgi:hypothetical protein